MLVCLSLVCFTFGAEAQTKKKAKTKAKTTAAAPAIKKNAAGYAMVAGHTYKANLPDGTSYTVTFKAGGRLTLKLSAGGRSQSVPGEWEQQNNAVALYDSNTGSLVMGGIVSDDGKTIECQSMYGEEMTFKLVR